MARTRSPCPSAAMRTVTGVPSAMPSSDRMLRTAVTVSMSSPMRASVSGPVNPKHRDRATPGCGGAPVCYREAHDQGESHGF